MNRKFNFFWTIISIFSFSFLSFSQIESGKIVPKTETSEKEVKVKTPKEKKVTISTPNSHIGKSFLFIGAGPTYSQNIIWETNNLFSDPLGIKSQEVGKMNASVGINYKISVAKKWYVNFGIDYTQVGEKFAWKSQTTDSSYAYTNRFNLISIPIGVNFITGDKVQFIGGLGLAPQIVVGAKQVINYTTENKQEKETYQTLREEKNDFNLAGFVQAGVQFKMTEGLYFFLLPEFRYSLFNTLSDQASYGRKYWSLGGQAGISFTF